MRFNAKECSDAFEEVIRAKLNTGVPTFEDLF